MDKEFLNINEIGEYLGIEDIHTLFLCGEWQYSSLQSRPAYKIQKAGN